VAWEASINNLPSTSFCIDDPSSAIQKILKETTFVDIFLQIAGDPGQIHTYSRGCKRIDYV
jgi:hypothetical protein